MGCAVCAEGAAQAVGTESLPGDWGPISDAGPWLRPIGSHAPYLACRRCRAVWQIGWDPRDQVHWSVTELPPGADTLLRAGVEAREAVRTAAAHPLVHGALDHYLWDARYDVGAAVEAILGVLVPRKGGEARDWGLWLGTLEQLLRSPHRVEAAAALRARTDVLAELQRPPPGGRPGDWAAFRQALAPVLARAAEASAGPPKADFSAMAAAADPVPDALAVLRDFTAGRAAPERALAELGMLSARIRAEDATWSDDELAVLFATMERLEGLPAGRHVADLLRQMLRARLRAGGLPHALVPRALAVFDPDLVRQHRPAQFGLPERVPAGCARCRTAVTAGEGPDLQIVSGNYSIPRAPGNAVLACRLCRALWWRRMDLATGRREASAMPASAAMLLAGTLTVQGLLAFLASPDYPPIRLAGAFMLAWRWVEVEPWDLPAGAPVFAAAFRAPAPDFDLTCDRLELLRLALVRSTREVFPFDTATLGARLLSEPAWLAPVLPSKRPAAREYLVALLKRIPA